MGSGRRLALWCAGRAGCLCGMAGAGEKGLNLVPEEPADTLNYWCTWSLQYYAGGNKAEPFARDQLTEKTVFGPGGWADTIFPKVKGDLYLVLDDGWDLPLEKARYEAYYGSLEVQTQRWPRCTGSYEQRLGKLNEMAKEHGWKGVGLWICAQESKAVAAREMEAFLKEHPQAKGGVLKDPYAEHYWTERLRWSRNAGIRYWKVDWGERQHSHEFRRWLTETARTEAPELTIEHAWCRRPFNERWDENGIGMAEADWVENAAKTVQYSDVFRLYDHSNQLGVPTMLERIAQVLHAVKAKTEGLGLLHCEHEVYMAAALGLNVGEMRHPFAGGADVFFHNPKRCKERLDEVVRGLRWQRLATPFGAGTAECFLDEKILFDEYDFSDKTFWTGDRMIRQGAPARVSRGIALPEVRGEGVHPYAAASRYPNGAVAIATFGRLCDGNREYRTPRADVVLNVGNATGPIGIFGYYKTLTLAFDAPVSEKARIWGQDLAGDEAVDITQEAEVSGSRFTLTGGLIERIGLSAASQGDVSDPGMVLVIR